MSTILQKSISLLTMTKMEKMNTMLYVLYNIVLIVRVVGFSDDGPAQPLPRHLRPRRGQPQVAQRLHRRPAAPDRVAYVDVSACVFCDDCCDGCCGEGL